MKSLVDVIYEDELNKYENRLFSNLDNKSSILFNIIDIDQIIYNNYEFYKKHLYETLTKTYDVIKFANYLDKNFKEIEIISEYGYGKEDVKFNDRLVIQTSNKYLNKDKEFISACDLFGYKIAQAKNVQNKLIMALEPIYFNEKSIKINKMKYLYHVVKYDNEYKNFENVKESFKKKHGLKPSKREKKSKHFRRTYCFVENCKLNDILSISGSYDNFCLIRINLQDYLDDFPNRNLEWFEDPNTNNGIWTREMIPYKYLEFFDIKNKNKNTIINILNEGN